MLAQLTLGELLLVGKATLDKKLASEHSLVPTPPSLTCKYYRPLTCNALV